MIVGLGNPGPKYKNTRHNLGFVVLDRIAERLGVKIDREKQNGLLAEAKFGNESLLLVKPQTFMNRSGDCVAPLVRQKIHEPGNVLVIVDEVALPLGKLRLRPEGSAGGHNGLKSLIERMGTQGFPRLRMGVGMAESGGDLADHVLSTFKPDEYGTVNEMVERGAEAALRWVEAGHQAVMNEFN